MTNSDRKRWTRRDFLRTSIAGLAACPAVKWGSESRSAATNRTRVAVIKTQDRGRAVRESLKLLDVPSMKGKTIFLKPNFNTADPFPAGTHNDTLVEIIREVRARGAAGITLGERSGPPPTRKVMEDKGIFDLARKLEFDVINFEELADSDWVHFNPPGNHWSEGFWIPRPMAEAEYIVSTCCLKTHQYGGVITMSLKLSVGATPKRLMRELHRSPDQRKMIAEINTAYTPKLILMDGLEAFVDGGPSTGRKVQPDVFIAGTDRVAVDAVGVAVLKDLGSNEAIMNSKIFEVEQIRRAAELGLGVHGPEGIELVAPDDGSREYADRLRTILDLG